MLQNGAEEHEGAAKISGSCLSVSNNPAVTWVPARNTRMWKSVRSSAFIHSFYSGLFVQNDDGESEQTGGKLPCALLRWGSAILPLYSLWLPNMSSHKRWMLNKRTWRFIFKSDLLFLMFLRYLHSSPIGYPALFLSLNKPTFSICFNGRWTSHDGQDILLIPDEPKVYWCALHSTCPPIVNGIHQGPALKHRVTLTGGKRTFNYRNLLLGGFSPAF